MEFFDHHPFLAAWFGAALLYILNILNNRRLGYRLRTLQKDG